MFGDFRAPNHPSCIPGQKFQQGIFLGGQWNLAIASLHGL